MRLNGRWVAGFALVVAAAVAGYFLAPGLLGWDQAGEGETALALVERSGRFTILYDNIPFNGSCATEWGFSCLVELGDDTVLFDTGGDPEVLAHNVEALGVDLAEVDYLVLSHEHWDHVGGLGPGWRPGGAGGGLREHMVRMAPSNGHHPHDRSPGLVPTGRCEKHERGRGGGPNHGSG